MARTKSHAGNSDTEVAGWDGPSESEAEYGAVEVAQTADGDIVVQSVTTAQLAEITSFEDALRLAQDIYGELIPSYDLGDGFIGLPDKSLLVGEPFVVMGWGLGWSAYGDDDRFSILRVVTIDGRKFRFSDGSSGIHKTLMDKFDGDPANFRALVALGGLTRSEYQPRNPDGSFLTDSSGKVVKSATTYHFNVDKLDIASVRG